MVRANHTMLIEDNSLQSKTQPSVKPSIQSAMEAVSAVAVAQFPFPRVRLRRGKRKTRPCTHKAAGQLMSAQHPTASEKRTSPKFAFGPGGDVAEHVSPALRSRECGDCARPAQPRSRRVENAHRPRRSRVRCVE